MGAEIKQLRTRIKSVNSTLHLTKAMGLVASSKIRKATECMLQSRDYITAFKSAVDLMVSSPECRQSPYIHASPGNKICLVVVAGDRGLAGGYNANIFRFMRDYPEAAVISIGKRAWEQYSGEEMCSSEHFTTRQARQLAETLCDEFVAGTYDRVGIVWTQFVSVMAQEPTVTWILPLERQEQKPAFGVLFEPDALSVFHRVIVEYVTGLLVAKVQESFACEVAARRNAMDSAQKNAQEMIDELRLSYNRARQGTITQEITEIVAGSGS